MNNGNDRTRQEQTDTELSARELAIARKAADLAVKQMTEEFYSSVGRTVINRFLIVVGALFVGVAYGKGWFGTFSQLFK